MTQVDELFRALALRYRFHLKAREATLAGLER
jgi:hypothetical protein